MEGRKDFLNKSYPVPTLGTHIPDDWEFADAFSVKISSEYRGKPGPYVRDLIERDLAKKPVDAMAPDVLVTLTRELLGKLDAEVVEKAFEGRDQRSELRFMLRQLILAIQDHGPGTDLKRSKDSYGKSAVENMLLRAAEIALQRTQQTTDGQKK